VNTPCQLCGKRRAKRFCPGVHGDICPQCCGTERENTVDCPLDCVHLQEARRHERPVAIDAANLPNADIRVTEDFVERHGELVAYVAAALAVAVAKAGGVDNDTREALDALIRTYRTRQSGLIYDTRPQNPYAARILEHLEKSVSEMREALAKETGLHTMRDGEILGALVFLQRLELQHNNGRRRGRAFASFLSTWFPAETPAAAPAILS